MASVLLLLLYVYFLCKKTYLLDTLLNESVNILNLKDIKIGINRKKIKD